MKKPLLILYFISVQLSIFSQTTNSLPEGAANNNLSAGYDYGAGFGALNGFCLEQGVTYFNVTYKGLDTFVKYEGCYYAAIHTIGILWSSDNVCLKSGIGIQMRLLDSYYYYRNYKHIFLDPSFYLKMDIRLYRAMYITPGMQFMFYDLFNPGYKREHNEPIWDWDFLPQLGLGYIFGVATFELVYKHGIFPLLPSRANFGNQYFALRLFLQWK